MIYILDNSDMPNVLKVGRTGDKRLSKRIQEHNSGSNVIGTWRCIWRRSVDDDKATERELLDALKRYKTYGKREQFKCSPERAKAIAERIVGVNQEPRDLEASNQRKITAHYRAPHKRILTPNPHQEQLSWLDHCKELEAQRARGDIDHMEHNRRLNAWRIKHNQLNTPQEPPEEPTHSTAEEIEAEVAARATASGQSQRLPGPRRLSSQRHP